MLVHQLIFRGEANRGLCQKNVKLITANCKKC